MRIDFNTILMALGTPFLTNLNTISRKQTFILYKHDQVFPKTYNYFLFLFVFF
jgi:hypothetical protein